MTLRQSALSRASFAVAANSCAVANWASRTPWVGIFATCVCGSQTHAPEAGSRSHCASHRRSHGMWANPGAGGEHARKSAPRRKEGHNVPPPPAAFAPLPVGRACTTRRESALKARCKDEHQTTVKPTHLSARSSSEKMRAVEPMRLPAPISDPFTRAWASAPAA